MIILLFPVRSHIPFAKNQRRDLGMARKPHSPYILQKPSVGDGTDGVRKRSSRGTQGIFLPIFVIVFYRGRQRHARKISEKIRARPIPLSKPIRWGRDRWHPKALEWGIPTDIFVDFYRRFSSMVDKDIHEK
jgi:hypothetical protein